MNIVATVADIVSAAYLLVIIIGLYYIGAGENDTTRAFKACVWFCFAGLFMDLLSYNMQGHVRSELLLGVVTWLAYTLYDFFMAAYGFYLYLYIRAKSGKTSRVFLYTVLGLCAADIMYYTFGMLSGQLLVIENGFITVQPWYGFVSVVPMACLTVYVIFLLGNIRSLSITDIIILNMYNIMQVVMAVLWTIEPELVSGFVVNALVLTVIFVIIQFRLVAESSLQAKISGALSVRDALTGLKNRRAYGECLDAVAPETEIQVVFCDVNSLKAVNDTLGHEAGDRLIKKWPGSSARSLPTGRSSASAGTSSWPSCRTRRRRAPPRRSGP